MKLDDHLGAEDAAALREFAAEDKPRRAPTGRRPVSLDDAAEMLGLSEAQAADARQRHQAAGQPLTAALRAARDRGASVQDLAALAEAGR